MNKISIVKLHEWYGRFGIPYTDNDYETTYAINSTQIITLNFLQTGIDRTFNGVSDSVTEVFKSPLETKLGQALYNVKKITT